jgi:hypothetical protein
MTVEPYASGETNGGNPDFYVGLTQVNFGTNSNPSTYLGTDEAFCDDFNDEITVPDTYLVTVTAVAGNKTLEEEAFYGMMFGSTPSGNSAVDSAIQELIWNMSAPASNQFAMSAGMSLAQTYMLDNYSSANYSGDFYLNANGDGGQSFMVDTSPAPTPEPPTLLTLATGLIGLAFVARRRLVQS